MQKIGFGGSCHWCTEAIFRSLKGVSSVNQGWIASDSDNNTPSEAVIVHFNQEQINLETLVAIHLHTHSCTAEHTMRGKYRSAVYTFDNAQLNAATAAIKALQTEFEQPVITKALPFQTFKLNSENYLDYYYKDPSKPFCQNIVNPKLKALLMRFKNQVDPDKQNYIQNF
ncbi:peptide-methionine (S)-S-oxide reductase [Mucilaginibacter endophyticus]|uniref:peptide-methionine (S)-S-oxide reductase n=1 Tax=Mucilaginibacter endophyticus TaxID=2675003 RepID=UPI000E0DE48C|nr:peptide-methionine (S)-S-oxide reductase [Mucilaginibacter endophyticus]